MAPHPSRTPLLRTVVIRYGTFASSQRPCRRTSGGATINLNSGSGAWTTMTPFLETWTRAPSRSYTSDRRRRSRCSPTTP